MQISIKETVFVYMLQDDEEIRWHSRSHKHGKNEYEIHYFIQGEGSFKNASITRAITPGSLFFSTPEDTHSVIPASKDFPVTYYAILFSNECSDKEFSLLLSDIIQNKKNYNVGTNYRFFFEELKDKFLSNNKNRVNSGIHQFISFLYLLKDGTGEFNYGDSRNVHIEKALKIMQNNVFSNLNLDSLSEKLKLNKSYFIRLFNSKMNITPKQYYLNLKMEAASSLLTSTSLPIYDIADKLCFYSEFHFSKSFKQHKGVPPTEYRNNYRN